MAPVHRYDPARDHRRARGAGLHVPPAPVRRSVPPALRRLPGARPAERGRRRSRQVIGPHGLWLVPLATTIGGLISGVLVYSFAPEAEGHGTDTAVRAYHRAGGFIRMRVPAAEDGRLGHHDRLGRGGRPRRADGAHQRRLGLDLRHPDGPIREERRLLVLDRHGGRAVGHLPLADRHGAVRHRGALQRHGVRGGALLYTMLAARSWPMR